MASETEIATLRRMTDLSPDDATYTDSLVGGMIDDLGMEPAVRQVWREKAAAVAGLVDTTESGSSRALSKLRDAYLGMADASNTSVEETGHSKSYTVGVERV